MSFSSWEMEESVEGVWAVSKGEQKKMTEANTAEMEAVREVIDWIPDCVNRGCLWL